MRAIQKFQLPLRGSVFLDVPKDTEFMQALAQGEQDIVLYGIVDLHSTEREHREIHIFSTGFDGLPALGSIAEEYRYLGTAILYGGAYVAHVFERHQFAEVVATEVATQP